MLIKIQQSYMNLNIKIISIDTSNSINTRNYISLSSESIFETINMIIEDTFSEDKIKQILAKMLFCGQSMDIGYRGTKIKIAIDFSSKIKKL